MLLLPFVPSKVSPLRVDHLPEESGHFPMVLHQLHRGLLSLGPLDHDLIPQHVDVIRADHSAVCLSQCIVLELPSGTLRASIDVEGTLPVEDFLLSEFIEHELLADHLVLVRRWSFMHNHRVEVGVILRLGHLLCDNLVVHT